MPIISLNEYLGYKSASDEVNNEKISVIVVSKKNRLFGVEVNSILDVNTYNVEIQSPLKESKGILGGILIGENQIATVINILSIIDDVLGETTDVNAPKKMKFKKGKILFAEDTVFFVKQVKKLLEQIGMEVYHAPDGEAALKMLSSQSAGFFDLILSDIEMPKMNGFDLAKNIRQLDKGKNIPMIALTTRFRESDRKHGEEVGFNKYLEKLKSDQLLEVMQEYLGG